MPIPLGILAVAGAGAAGGGGAFDLLETTLISTNTASLTFSGLGSYSDYKHLQIRFTARTSHAAAGRELDLVFNGSVVTSRYHNLSGTGSSVYSAQGTELEFREWVLTGANQSANIFGAGVIDILDFSNTNKNKVIRGFGGYDGTSPYINLGSGLAVTTSAITSIQLSAGDGSLVAGSRFSLYGIK